jgi:hypothetical protein
MLPSRNLKDEQRFILELQQLGEQDQIQNVITEAIEERRPQLAAQLFLLLKTITPLSGDLEKANKALRFGFVSGQQWFQIEEAWNTFSSSNRIHRMKTRHRDKDDLRNRPWKRR